METNDRSQGRNEESAASASQPDTKGDTGSQTKAWKCGNCGYVTEGQTDDLTELGFKFEGPLTSRTTCQNCGSFTLQRAYDNTFMAGRFEVVKTFNNIRGKSKCKN
jgi:ribosomal protein S27AE